MASRVNNEQLDSCSSELPSSARPEVGGRIVSTELCESKTTKLRLGTKLRVLLLKTATLGQGTRMVKEEHRQ